MEICLFTLGLWSAETWKSSKNALYFCCPQVLLYCVSNNGPTVDKRLQEVILIHLVESTVYSCWRMIEICKRNAQESV